MEKIYYSITEVAERIQEEPSTLRFWEKKFPQLQPKVAARGVRKYTIKDIELIETIQYLLRKQGLKIEAAQKRLNSNKDGEQKKQKVVETLTRVRKELMAIRKEINANEVTNNDIIL